MKDRADLETVVRDHQRAVYGYLRARVIQTTDAEDLTQEVFVRYYIARARFDPRNELRPWLFGIARNLLREHARRNKRKREISWTDLCLECEDDSPEEEGLYDDVTGYLPGCLNSLGQNARKAIDFRYSGEMGMAEIGERMKRSEGAIKLLMFRARQALKRCLSTKLGSGNG